MLRARPRFYLKEPSGTDDTLVMCTAYVAGKRLKISTGIKVNPKKWNPNLQRMKRGTANEALINQRLDQVAMQLVSIALQLRNAGAAVTAKSIVDRFKSQITDYSSTVAKSLLDCYAVYIDQQTSKLQHGSIQVHRTAKKHVREFSASVGITLDFDRIDTHWFDRFFTYLTSTRRLNNISAWKVLKTFRAFLRWAHEHELTSNDAYRSFTRRRIPSGQQSLKPYLTLSELQTLIGLDLTSSPRLDRTRDLAVLQALTGLRIGDVLKFRKELVDGNRLTLVTSKNRRAITIPILPPVKAVIDKYDGVLPVISVQKHNEALKDLLKFAGINQEIVIVDFRGSARVETIVPKYEAISTHSLKRSFVTVMSQKGVSIEALCRITGNTAGTLRSYLVGTSEDAIRELENAWR